MRNSLSYVAIFLLASAAVAQQMGGASNVKVRVKDVTRIGGSETYTLVGYGLIVGLNGSGDSDEELTQRTISNLLQKFNIVVDEESIKAQNTAAVMITAEINQAAHEGDMIAATLSSIGDATSLTGGELLLTPLLGTDGKPWAIGQGAVTTGAFQVGGSGGGGETQSKNHPTVGLLTNGVKLLRDVGLGVANTDAITLCLKRPDYTTAANMAESINSTFQGAAIAIDSATVRVMVPKTYREEQRFTEFVRELEQLEFSPDSVAKVVINERTGTIVFGGNVKLSSVAISQGNLTITIKNTEGVSQAGAFAPGGSTQNVSNQETTVREEHAPIHLIPDVTTVSELVGVLNALGVTPRDTMVIMHALRDAGALHAELETM